MMYYTSRCPYCGYYLEIHNSKYHSKIDSELLPCPNCRKLYQTGKKLWDNMDENEKDDFYFVEYFKAVVVALIFSLFFAAVIFNALLKFDINWVTFIISCLIVFPLIILSTKKQLKTETQTTFEDALLRHWKNYINNCDSELKNANKEIRQKYNCTFFELEKNKLPRHVYEQIKYNPINERIKFLYNVIENNIIFKEENLFKEPSAEEDFPEEVLDILADKDRLKNILDGKENIDKNLFLGIENPCNGNKIETMEDIMQYLHFFYLSYSNGPNETKNLK